MTVESNETLVFDQPDENSFDNFVTVAPFHFETAEPWGTAALNRNLNNNVSEGKIITLFDWFLNRFRSYFMIADDNRWEDFRSDFLKLRIVDPIRSKISG